MNNTKLSKTKQALNWLELNQDCNVRRAAEKFGISPSNIYTARKNYLSTASNRCPVCSKLCDGSHYDIVSLLRNRFIKIRFAIAEMAILFDKYAAPDNPKVSERFGDAVKSALYEIDKF